MILGRISGKVTTTEFQFNAEENARKFEYVQIMHEEFGFVLGQVIEIIKDSNGTIAQGIVLGYRDDNGGLRGMTYPFEPGTEVLLAEDELISKVLGLEGNENNAYVGILQGRDKLKVYLDLNRILTKHVNVLAKSGSGKSYNVGVLLEELLEKNVPIVILDPHGEYSTLKYPNPKDRDRMQMFAIEPKGYLEQIDEFSTEEKNAKPLKLNSKNLTSGELIKLLPAKLSSTQQGILYSALKNLGGKVDFNELVFELEASEDNSAKWTLINIMEYLKKLKLFSDNPTLPGELVRPGKATIINLKGVAPEIQEIIVYKLVNDLFMERKKNNIPPFFLVVEEAHNFIPERSFGEAKSSAILRQIAAEGRKFGLGLCVISQRPSRVDKSVLSQASTQIILKVTNPNDVRAVANSVEGITKDTVNEIQNLPIGTALVTGVVDNPIFVDIRPRRSKHGGEAVNIFAQQPKVEVSEDEVEEFKEGEVVPAVSQKYSVEDYKLMHGKKPKVELIPAILLTCEQNNEDFNVLVELINLNIVSDLEKVSGNSLLNLNIDKISPKLQGVVDTAIKLKSFKPADIFGKAGIQFSELFDAMKDLEKKGYLVQDGTQYRVSESIEFLSSLNEYRFYDPIDFVRVEGEKLEAKYPLETVKDFLSKFVDIKNIKECFVVKYT
ncbi:MAG: ATP-binding protein [archaeon]